MNKEPKFKVGQYVKPKRDEVEGGIVSRIRFIDGEYVYFYDVGISGSIETCGNESELNAGCE